MTRSVEELRRESERSRAELAGTVDQLRAQISHTAEDIRHKVSPQHIKSEVSDYVSYKTRNWVETLKQRAMENPMQAIVAGTAVAIPVLRLARGSSLPLLMIGAGLALTSKTVRDRAVTCGTGTTQKKRMTISLPSWSRMSMNFDGSETKKNISLRISIADNYRRAPPHLPYVRSPDP